ncbi:hypothetical protein GOODEAATRI_010459, partial [Goodea atripinnis]
VKIPCEHVSLRYDLGWKLCLDPNFIIISSDYNISTRQSFIAVDTTEKRKRKSL